MSVPPEKSLSKLNHWATIRIWLEIFQNYPFWINFNYYQKQKVNDTKSQILIRHWINYFKIMHEAYWCLDGYVSLFYYSYFPDSHLIGFILRKTDDRDLNMVIIYHLSSIIEWVQILTLYVIWWILFRSFDRMCCLTSRNCEFGIFMEVFWFVCWA